MITKLELGEDTDFSIIKNWVKKERKYKISLKSRFTRQKKIVI